jgi:hypothetical protein
MADTSVAKPSRAAVLDREMEAAAYEGFHFAVKALRGEVDMADGAAKAQAKIATTAASAWARARQTQSAQRAINAAVAHRLASDTDGRFAEALAITMPDDPIVVGLAARAKRLGVGADA